MIKPLQLGTQIYPVNLIQGPLAGISCAPFRRLIWQHGKPAFSCTEMISCKTLIHQATLSYQRYVKKDPQEGPVCFQLSSNNPNELAEATRRVTAYGADLIDLNCGCPVNKIRRKGAGSSLLTDPLTLYKLICAMKKNTHLPVSVKIRVQGQSNEKCNQNVARVIQDAGADFLVVHGRHWTEHYETPCRHDEIQFFVEALSIPVIGNGDIACVASLKKMFATGCAGVMIGRAGVGQPWLIRKLISEMQEEKFYPPSLREVGDMLIEHADSLAVLLNNEKFAILQTRKFAKYYAHPLKNKISFMAEINTCENLQQLTTTCQSYFRE